MAARDHDISTHSLAQKALLFLLIATLYHSAFCVWNDICDKDFDGKVGESYVCICLVNLSFISFLLTRTNAQETTRDWCCFHPHSFCPVHLSIARYLCYVKIICAWKNVSWYLSS